MLGLGLDGVRVLGLGLNRVRVRGLGLNEVRVTLCSDTKQSTFSPHVICANVTFYTACVVLAHTS